MMRQALLRGDEMSPRIHVRVDFSDSCSIGPGKIGLLEQIERTGSLSGAARELKMSYRRAWLLLTSANTGFSEPVAQLSTGGIEGGGAKLTAFGRKLVADYRGFEQGVHALAQKAFAGVRVGRGGSSEPVLKPRAIKRPVKGAAPAR
jgi:molybdate transport system regulatory protein